MSRARKIISGIFLFIALFIALNNAVFTHEHIVDGKMITHAHPYNIFHKTAPTTENHHHDKNTLNIIHLFNVLLFYGCIFIIIASIFKYIIRSLEIQFSIHLNKKTYQNSLSERAPPSYCI